MTKTLSTLMYSTICSFLFTSLLCLALLHFCSLLSVLYCTNASYNNNQTTLFSFLTPVIYLISCSTKLNCISPCLSGWNCNYTPLHSTRYNLDTSDNQKISHAVHSPVLYLTVFSKALSSSVF